MTRWGAGARGFSLLEAIVALVLLSTSGIAIYGLVNTNLISFRRVHAIDARTVAVRNAIEWVRQINPAGSPEGKGSNESHGLEISWKAHALGPMLDGFGYPGGTGLYQLGLYDTEVVVSREGAELARFTIRQVGYRQVRQALAGIR